MEDMIKEYEIIRQGDKSKEITTSTIKYENGKESYAKIEQTKDELKIDF